MKHILAGLVVCAAAAALSGCYVSPGYSYVRHTPYQGDAYYGQGARVYDDGYYGVPGYPAYGYGYGYGYGCCYAPGVSVGIRSTWYSTPRYRDGWRGYGNGWRGDWRGQRDGRGDSRRGHGGAHGDRPRGDRDGRPRQ